MYKHCPTLFLLVFTYFTHYDNWEVLKRLKKKIFVLHQIFLKYHISWSTQLGTLCQMVFVCVSWDKTWLLLRWNSSEEISTASLTLSRVLLERSAFTYIATSTPIAIRIYCLTFNHVNVKGSHGFQSQPISSVKDRWVIILSRAVLSNGTFCDSGHVHILPYPVCTHHPPLAFEHLKYWQQVWRAKLSVLFSFDQFKFTLSHHVWWAAAILDSTTQDIVVFLLQNTELTTSIFKGLCDDSMK